MLEDYDKFHEIPPFAVKDDPTVRLINEDAPWLRRKKKPKHQMGRLAGDKDIHNKWKSLVKDQSTKVTTMTQDCGNCSDYGDDVCNAVNIALVMCNNVLNILCKCM